MANQYDTNLKLQAIADAIGDTSSSGLIQALEDIADAVAGGGGGGSSTAGLVSDNFSETDTYDLGDYCIHNNTLYVCINAITTPGPWDLSDWQATNAGLELSSLNSAIEGIAGAPTIVAQTANEVAVGGYVDITVPSNYPALSKATQIVIESSFNRSWTYSVRQIIPYIVGGVCRYYHVINSSSEGTIQYNILNERTIRITNVTNESMLYRVYAKYI